MSNMTSTGRGDLASSVLDRLRDLSENSPTESYRAVARAIVDLRAAFEYNGLPDWSGRSPEYRDMIERLYRQAELPPDSEASTQSKLRYHIGNVMRELAPAEDLEALGLAKKGPAGRQTDGRKRVPAEVRKTRADNPLILSALALDAVRLLGVVDYADGDREVVEKVVRQVIDEAVTFLAKGRGTSS